MPINASSIYGGTVRAFMTSAQAEPASAQAAAAGMNNVVVFAKPARAVLGLVGLLVVLRILYERAS